MITHLVFSQTFISAGTTELELASMKLAIGQPNGVEPSFRKHYFWSCSNEADPCTWRGIVCEAGAIEELAWVESQSFHVIFAEWLPSTLQRLYLKSLHLGEDFSARSLPKSLTYAYISHAAKRNSRGGAADTIHFDAFNFSALPQQMDELHFVSCALGGTVNITALPKHMRILSLFNCSFEKVFVYSDGLPHSLDRLQVYDVFKKTKCVPIGAKKFDPRVTSDAYFSEPTDISGMQEKGRQLERVFHGIM